MSNTELTKDEIIYCLEFLSTADPEEYEVGDIEIIIGETERGADIWKTYDINDIAKKALELIDKQDSWIPIEDGITKKFSADVNQEIEWHTDIKENIQYMIKTKSGDGYVGVISTSFYWKKFNDRSFWCLTGINVDGGDFSEGPNILKIPVEEVLSYQPLPERKI